MRGQVEISPSALKVVMKKKRTLPILLAAMEKFQNCSLDSHQGLSIQFQADKPKSAFAGASPEGQVAPRHHRGGGGGGGTLGGRGLGLRLGGVPGVGRQVHAALPLAATPAAATISLETKR